MVPGGNGTIGAAVPGGKTAAGGRQYLEGAAAQNVAPVGSSAMGEWAFLGMALRGTVPVESNAAGERCLW